MTAPFSVCLSSSSFTFVCVSPFTAKVSTTSAALPFLSIQVQSLDFFFQPNFLIAPPGGRPFCHCFPHFVKLSVRAIKGPCPSPFHLRKFVSTFLLRRCLVRDGRFVMAETAAAYIAAADMAASTKYPELEQISDPTMMAQQNGVDKDEKCLFPDILILFQVEIILKTILISRAFSSIFKLRNSKKKERPELFPADQTQRQVVILRILFKFRGAWPKWAPL